MQRLACALFSLAFFALFAGGHLRADDEAAESPPETTAADKQTATHKQVRSIRPAHSGNPIHLNTYCLSPEGDILACVGGANYTYEQDANGNYTTKSIVGTSLVQVYSSEGDLKAEWPVPFKPSAINVAPDNTIFVAGDGKMARLNAQGEILTTANIPNIGDPDEMRAQALAKLQEQNEDLVARLQKQMDFAKEQAEKIESVPEEDRSASQKARLKAYTRQQELYEAQLTALKEQAVAVAPEISIGNAGNVTALAVSDSHVFVCASSTKGSGYDVYRCDFDFQNPQEVLSELHGCCGQMDIQAHKDRLLTAENTKFRVGIYDEDGKSLDSFGSRNRSGGAGFGSCCNPMNVRCCSNGEILTAESSIGDIKRFSADGEFLGYIGRAKISGGCKHVAIAWDEARDRYYMMNISDSSICVLVPLSEAPEFTEDELLAKAAQEGLGQKLIGDWKIPGTKAPKKQSAFASALSSLLGGGGEAAGGQANVPFERVGFEASGKLSISGGMYGQYGISDWTWTATRQDLDKQSVDFAMLNDGIEFQSFRCEFQENGQLAISVLVSGQSTMTGTFAKDGGDSGEPRHEDPATPAVTLPAVEVAQPVAVEVQPE